MKWFVQAILFVLGVAVLGAGVPLAWLWVASRFQGSVGGGTEPLAVLALVLGIPITYAGITTVAHPLAHRGRPPTRRHSAWNRPLGGDRPREAPASRVETLFVTTTLVVAVVVEVHIVFFAHPGVPSGP